MSTSKVVLAPVAGVILEVLGAVGAPVAEGDELLIIESMKMEIPVDASATGTLASVAVSIGDHVNEGDELAVIS